MTTLLLLLALQALPPPPPSYVAPPPVLHSPKHAETVASLGVPMSKVVARLTPAFVPTDFAITNLTVNGGTVNLQWQQGQPLFQVQGTDLTGAWSNIGGLTTAHQKSFSELPQHFFRVIQSNSLPLIINPTNQPRVTWNVPELDMSDTLQTYTLQETQTAPPANQPISDNTGWSPSPTTPSPAANATSANDTTGTPVWYRLKQTTANGVVVPYDVGVLNTAGSGHLNWLWAAGNAAATVYGIAIDSLGSTIVAGSFASTVNFGNGNVSKVGNFANGFIAKYDTSGSLVWIRTFSDISVVGGAFAVAATSVAVDSQNRVIASGKFKGKINLGGSDLTQIGGTGDIFLSIFTTDNSPVVSKNFGVGANDSSVSIDRTTVNSTRDYLFLAFKLSLSSAAFDSFTLTRTSGSVDDVGVVKFNTSGTATVAKNYGVSSQQILNISGATDKNGDVIVSGGVSSAANFGGSNATIPAFINIFLVKYSGATLSYGGWDHVLGGGGGGGQNRGNAVATDFSSGNIVVVGSYSGSPDFGNSHIASGNTGVFVAVYNSSGVCQNLVTSGSSGAGDACNCVAVASGGDIAVGASVSGIWSFAPYPASTPSASGNGNFTYCAGVFGSDLSAKWLKRSANSGSTGLGAGIGFDSSGRVLIGGWIEATTVFSDTITVNAGGSPSGFLGQYQR